MCTPCLLWLAFGRDPRPPALPWVRALQQAVTALQQGSLKAKNGEIELFEEFLELLGPKDAREGELHL